MREQEGAHTGGNQDGQGSKPERLKGREEPSGKYWNTKHPKREGKDPNEPAGGPKREVTIQEVSQTGSAQTGNIPNGKDLNEPAGGPKREVLGLEVSQTGKGNLLNGRERSDEAEDTKGKGS